MKDSSSQKIRDALNTVYWCWEFRETESCPPTVLTALERGLPHISKDSWNERFDLGGVYINGIMALEDRPLTSPCKVEYYEPKKELSELRGDYANFDPSEHILYEDEDLIIAFKPAKLHVLPPKEQRFFHLKGELERYVGHAVHCPSRLDFSTSGVVAVSKSTRMHNHLQQAFERRQIQKKYLLEVSGTPAWQEFTADGAIGYDPRHPVLRTVDGRSAKEALTHFEVIETRKTTSLLKAEPKTGRTHQIRVHISQAGYPIVGDSFYNDGDNEGLRLLSHSIGVEHPFLDQYIEVSVPERLRPSWAMS